MEDWGSLFQELVAAPKMDHVTGLDEENQIIEGSHTGNTCYRLVRLCGGNVIGLDRNSATLCGGTGPRGAHGVPAHTTTLPLQLAT